MLTMERKEAAEMRILILSSQAFSLLHFRIDMMKAFLTEGHEVYAAAPDQEAHWTKDLHAHGVSYHPILIDRTGKNPFKDIRSFLSILSVIKTVSPQVVFCYQAKTVIYGLIASTVSRVPYRYALIAGLGSVFRNTDQSIRAVFVKYILTVQYRFALQFAKKVYFQNKDDAGEFIDNAIVKRNRVEYMNGSGVNLENFPKTMLPEENRFLFVGRLIMDKGILEYLEAARIVRRQVPESVFDVVGYYDTNPTAISPQLLKPYFDEGIAFFHGQQEDVYPFIARCRFFVLPSYHEGTPKSILEALAVGRPVLTTDAPGCRDTVESGINGYVVPPQNAKALAEKMLYLIEHPTVSLRMAEASYRKACEKYDVRFVNKQAIQSMELQRKIYEPVNKKSSKK
ncbi:glycosyltransferase family 4 protein [Eubacteriales bacterium OttesenSCG-928-A19]|nr:glycosyltransferase family 4 protein [Eubacteriales bacterium OttesenSCG-928-A19]